MHGSERWRDTTPQIPDDTAEPRCYMIVYSLTLDGHTIRSGLYMFDEETVKTFPNHALASIVASDLIKFMNGCGYQCACRIVKVVKQ